MVSSTDVLATKPGSRRLLRGILLIAAAIAASLTVTARAQADNSCMSAQACYNAATWETAVANDYQNKGVFFRGYSTHYFGLAYEWNQKATFAFYAGDATAATWYKAIADDYSRKSVQNSKAADEHFAQAAHWRGAAQTSVNRARFFSALEDVGPSYPEGIHIAIAQPTGKYNCTGTAKVVKNQRKIEGLSFDLFSYRAETPWMFCNGKVTKMYPGELWQTSHSRWQFIGREKVRAACYGGTPERCAWSYLWHWKLDNPTVELPGGITINEDKYRDTCVTTQVRGDGAHYRHGGCDLKAWSGPQWGGKET
jgi:hypothetical protein